MRNPAVKVALGVVVLLAASLVQAQSYTIAGTIEDASSDLFVQFYKESQAQFQITSEKASELLIERKDGATYYMVGATLPIKLQGGTDLEVGDKVYTLVASNPGSGSHAGRFGAYMRAVPTTGAFMEETGKPIAMQSIPVPSGSAKGGAVSLTWKAVDSDAVIGYNIYRSSRAAMASSIEDYELVGTSTKPSFKDTSVAKGQSYTYALSLVFGGTAGDTKGVEGKVLINGKVLPNLSGDSQSITLGGKGLKAGAGKASVVK